MPSLAQDMPTYASNVDSMPDLTSSYHKKIINLGRTYQYSLPITAFSKEQVDNSLQIIDVLSNGNLLCSIVESKKDYENNNVVPFEKIAEMTDSEEDSPTFESLSSSKKSRIVREAAEHLFSKDDIDKAIAVIDELLDSSDPSKHNVADSDAFDADKWKEIQKHVTSIKSYLQGDALETTKN